MFTLLKKSNNTEARRGILLTGHGRIDTPCFMPIATKGAIKSLDIERFSELDPQVLLSNTYHLYLKPGLEILKQAGGLHKFMNWHKPILTDSGGFQAFSLGRRVTKAGTHKPKFTEEGVQFRSVYDGSKHLFTPESVIDTERVIGSDIMMILDECVENPSTHTLADRAVTRTSIWAERAIIHIKKTKPLYEHEQYAFAIVQGSVFPDLRTRSASELTKLPFDGYAIGGLAVGETNGEMYQMLDVLSPLLPKDKPRYLMGVGKPENIVEAVKRGVDMFDCVIPSREARHGRLYEFCAINDEDATPLFGDVAYKVYSIRNEEFSTDQRALVSNSTQTLLATHTRSYLSHLFRVEDPLAQTLATTININFYLELMRKIQVGIENEVI